ncbi:MAG: hypothetical protein CL908_16370 [Deltaproteobacteria bacterium]|nr:hypothetical protein [Deltaproteobacteria bacterium]
MTFASKVWGDAARRLQEEIPDFAFDAWIAPLAVKVADDRIVLGCPTSFHRERVRLHYTDWLLRCWLEAWNEQGADAGRTWSLELLSMPDFEAAPGHAIEVASSSPRADRSVAPQASPHRMRRVSVAAKRAEAVGSLAANGLPGAGPRSGGADLGTVAGRLRPETAHAMDSSRATGAPRVTSVEPTSRDSGSADPYAADASEPPALQAVPQTERRKRSGDVRNGSTDSGSCRDARSGDRRDVRGAPTLSAEPTQPELPFSFESFVVGPCNALAREAALALARARQRSLNQLYLGGESGMGKTHLARATAIEARRHGRSASSFCSGGFSGDAPGAAVRPDARRGPSSAGIIYTTAEQFTSEFVSAVRNGRSEDWQRRYRRPIELLIVEDVQHFSGRTKTQLELFHTVQHVLDAGGRVLLTGDRSPRELGGLDERMRDQVGRGFVAELEPPDALVRRHILRSKTAAGGVRLPADCLDLLVEATEGSIRDIEGVLIQVVTTASLLGRTIDLDLVREAVDLKSGAGSLQPPKRIEVAEIVRLVSAFFGKRPEALASRSRRRDVLVPRQLAMYLAHRYSDASLTEIGRGLGRDHPSVRNAITRVERLCLENAPMRYQVEALSERIDQVLSRTSEPAPPAGGATQDRGLEADPAGSE